MKSRVLIASVILSSLQVHAQKSATSPFACTASVYGVTRLGGTYNRGVVYKVDQTGNETVLYSFAGGTDGAYPSGSLIADSAGNLYGTTVGRHER